VTSRANVNLINTTAPLTQISDNHAVGTSIMKGDHTSNAQRVPRVNRQNEGSLTSLLKMIAHLERIIVVKAESV
jgi:hypothetical protein